MGTIQYLLAYFFACLSIVKHSILIILLIFIAFLIYSIPHQWPKRTHSNHHQSAAHIAVTSTTTTTTTTSKSIPIEVNDANNSDNDSKILQTALNATLSLNSANDGVKVNLISENGDIKFNRSHSELVSNSNSNSSSSSPSDGAENLISAIHSLLNKTKPALVKKTKYQDFDASLVPDEGIFSSIMKVLGLNQCPAMPPDLVGPIEVDATPEILEHVEARLSGIIQPGGCHKPSECRARDRVAIVIPFRDRKQHLPILLKNLHPFLVKQQIDYRIFIVEQSPDGSFNRAKLMNVGFTEALKLYEWDCFIFHDVDLLPMDDRNLYTCPDQPRHMSVAVDTFGFK
jgi:N-terminal region of glycosyl transferase group 7